jgi:hypothetical protein
LVIGVACSFEIGFGFGFGFGCSDIGDAAGEEDNERNKGERVKKAKKKADVYADEEGVPRLPAFEGLERPSLEEMKSLIRDFLNAHYSMVITF